MGAVGANGGLPDNQAIAAAVSGRKNAVAGIVQVEMHGITGGDDGYLVQE